MKIVTTMSHLLKLKCTEFDFGLGELTALPQNPSWILGGSNSKGREGRAGFESVLL